MRRRTFLRDLVAGGALGTLAQKPQPLFLLLRVATAKLREAPHRLTHDLFRLFGHW